MNHTAIVLLCIFVVVNLNAVLTDSGEHGRTVSAIFQASSEEKCEVKSSDGSCLLMKNLTAAKAENETDKKLFGPKFQKVHLQLPRINPVRTGYVRNINIIKNRTHEMKTLAIHPPIFEIKDFLSADECDALIFLAKEKGMAKPAPLLKDIRMPSENLHSVYDYWDQDLDGFLSMEEVSEIYEIKHLLLTENDLKEMYEKLGMEPDKNGHISYGDLEKASFAKFRGYLDNLNEMKANASVHNVEQTWLWHDEDELFVYDDVFQGYHERLSNLTKIPQKIVEQSERLQVTLFKNGSFTECRHDSDPYNPRIPCCNYGANSHCKLCRFLSVLFFLNDDVDGGELMFPLADNKTLHWDRLHKDTLKACTKSPNVNVSNLVIKPEKGKAIMWYNHYIGRDTGWVSSLDPLSFYGANHVSKGEKWIGTTWINIIGDGVNDVRPWKMGTNWLQGSNKNLEIIEQMRNDDFIEGEPYLHDSKLTVIDDDEVDKEKDVKMVNFDRTELAETEDDRDGENFEANVEKGEIGNIKTEQLQTEEDDVKTFVEGNENDTEKEAAMDLKENDKEQLKKSKERGTDDQNKGIVVELKKPVKQEMENILNRKLNTLNEDSNRKKKAAENRNRSPENGEGPLGPPLRESIPYMLPSGKMVENKLVMSVLMLIDELGRNELEIIARTLHEKLQLACIPIMINPIGPM